MENIKITFKLNSYAVLAKNPFDGVLAKLWFEELKQQNRFNGDYFQRLPFLEYDEEGFYHISNPIYTTKLLGNQILNKSFVAKEYIRDYPHKKITDKMFNQGSGIYKNYMAPYEKKLIDDVVVYARGDKSKIKNLLSKLHSIGKKSSYGWGKIKNITIETTSDNYSIVKDGVLMRNIPKNSKYLKKINCKIGYRLMQLTHPYWDRGREVVCAIKI